eukprot:gene7171-biopygen10538
MVHLSGTGTRCPAHPGQLTPWASVPRHPTQRTAVLLRSTGQITPSRQEGAQPGDGDQRLRVRRRPALLALHYRTQRGDQPIAQQRLHRLVALLDPTARTHCLPDAVHVGGIARLAAAQAERSISLRSVTSTALSCTQCSLSIEVTGESVAQ